MTVLFRADASAEIGTGHIMRCFALADALKTLGEECVFVCRDIPRLLAERITNDGYGLQFLIPTNGDNSAKAAEVPYAHWLKAPWRDDAVETSEIAQEVGADWIIVDHYGLDADWELAVATADRSVAAMDDLADRRHAAALVSDPSLVAEPHDRYKNLTAPGCQLLLGPRYAALRSEFSDAPPRLPAPGGEPMRFLIAFGGVDAAGMTRVAIEALAAVVEAGDHAHVVVGAAHEGRAAIAGRCAELGWTCHVNSSRMGQLMAAADLAIGAGGSMVWERMSMGLPTITIIVADNQRDQVNEAARFNLLVAVEQADASLEALREQIKSLRGNSGLREKMSAACRRRVDGKGAVRIARRIAPCSVKLRPATEADSADLLEWRNHELIRMVSHNTEMISPEDHELWLTGTLSNPARRLLIAADNDGVLGVLRFDKGPTNAEVSIYLAPQRLGSGLGPSLLMAGEAAIAEDWPDVLEILAEVLPTNRASKELFLSCGYRYSSGFYRKLVGLAS
jgi:UDP-2,4-diacetamido-2,4,6-trideoxy-beta-L-altropyranose hydrolase